MTVPKISSAEDEQAWKELIQQTTVCTIKRQCDRVADKAFEARQTYRKAVDICERTVSPKHLDLAYDHMTFSR